MEDKRIPKETSNRRWNWERSRLRRGEQHTLQEDGTDYACPNPWRWWWPINLSALFITRANVYVLVYFILSVIYTLVRCLCTRITYNIKMSNTWLYFSKNVQSYLAAEEIWCFYDTQSFTTGLQKKISQCKLFDVSWIQCTPTYYL
jgi:hypothetical protein